MRKILVFLFLLSALNGYSQENDDSIIGKWASVGRSKGGLGVLYTFAGQEMTQTFGALIDFKYKDDGQTITTTFIDPASGKPEQIAQPYEITGDTLIMNPGDPKKRQEMKRAGYPLSQAHPIRGAWTSKHYTGATAIMLYTNRGLAQFSVPMKTLTGDYTFKNGRLTVNLQGMPSFSRKVKLKGNSLVFLRDGKRKAERYKKVLFPGFPAATVKLLSPEPGAVLQNGSTNGDRKHAWTFKWSEVPQAQRYELYVIGPGSKTPLIWISQPRASYVKNMAEGYISEKNRSGWRWKVRAMVSGLWGNYSEERVFNVEPPWPTP